MVLFNIKILLDFLLIFLNILIAFKIIIFLFNIPLNFLTKNNLLFSSTVSVRYGYPKNISSPPTPEIRTL